MSFYISQNGMAKKSNESLILFIIEIGEPYCFFPFINPNLIYIYIYI